VGVTLAGLEALGPLKRKDDYTMRDGSAGGNGKGKAKNAETWETNKDRSRS